MVPVAKLRVETHPDDAAKPLAFGVFDGEKRIAVLTYGDVVDAISKYAAMQLGEHAAPLSTGPEHAHYWLDAGDYLWCQCGEIKIK